MTRHSTLIVVPARNEEETIGECLRSVYASVLAAQDKTSTLIVVVCDSCDDATYEVAETTLENLMCRYVLLRVNFQSVGKSRDWGVRTGLYMEPETTWIAFTDADTYVRNDWLKLQIAAANYGFDAFFGRVDFSTDTQVLRDFKTLYENQTHRYIHGANMGLSTSAYNTVGGIPLTTAHEDRILVDRLESMGLKVLWDERTAVHTSVRVVGRAPEGFARTLGLFVENCL